MSDKPEVPKKGDPVEIDETDPASDTSGADTPESEPQPIPPTPGGGQSHDPREG